MHLPVLLCHMLPCCASGITFWAVPKDQPSRDAVKKMGWGTLTQHGDLLKEETRGANDRVPFSDFFWRKRKTSSCV